MDDHTNQFGEFLTGLRESVASGESVYGPVGSPKQVEKLAELDAKIGLGRQLGEIALAPEPWSVQRAARERLAAEFPVGDPTAREMSETLSGGIKAQFDRLSQLSAREQADLAGQVADDFANQASAVSVRHSSYRDGGYPSGNRIVEALLREAEPAIAAFAKPGEHTKIMNLLRLDRQYLELMAVRGQAMSAYAKRKAELGL